MNTQMREKYLHFQDLMKMADAYGYSLLIGNDHIHLQQDHIRLNWMTNAEALVCTSDMALHRIKVAEALR